MENSTKQCSKTFWMCLLTTSERGLRLTKSGNEVASSGLLLISGLIDGSFEEKGLFDGNECSPDGAIACQCASITPSILYLSFSGIASPS